MISSLTIVSIISLLPIRLTICGDPLIWASVEAQAEFRTKPPGEAGAECSSPSTFQMRADGSWLPSTEFDLTGNFDEDCGIYLHLTIPEDDPKGLDPKIEELRSKMKELKNEKDDLDQREKQLLFEKKEHETKMAKEHELVETKDKEVKEVSRAIDNEDRKLKDLSVRQKSLEEKIKLFGTDINTIIDQQKKEEYEVSKSLEDAKTKVYGLREFLSGVCSRIPTSLYSRIMGEEEISSHTKAYICHLREHNHVNIIENMWDSEINKMKDKIKSLKDDIYLKDMDASQLNNERKIYEGDMEKIANEKENVEEKKLELTTIQSELDLQKKKEMQAKLREDQLNEKRKKLGDYSKEDFIERKESEVSSEISKVNKEISLQKNLIDLHKDNGCTSLQDSDYLAIKTIHAEQQDIMICEPE